MTLVGPRAAMSFCTTWFEVVASHSPTRQNVPKVNKDACSWTVAIGNMQYVFQAFCLYTEIREKNDCVSNCVNKTNTYGMTCFDPVKQFGTETTRRPNWGERCCGMF